MALTNLPFRYNTGRASHLAALIWSQDRSSVRTSGTTMTAIGSVASTGFAAGRLTATEKATSDAIGTGLYALSTFPALPAGFYVIDLYDVGGVTPTNAIPGPTDSPLSLDRGGLVYWDGATLIDGVQVVLFSAVALAQFAGIATPSAGSDAVTLNWTDSGTGFPIEGGQVWVTTDPAGDNVIWGTDVTDSMGNVIALLTAGNWYYFWARKDGEEPVLGSHFQAVADA